MVIEWLKFRVSPEAREKFVQKDEQIWTKFLSQYPGFLSKEVWISPKVSDEVIVVIRWQSPEKWKSIPEELSTQVEAKFAQAMGEDQYETIENLEYQVRKFPV